MVVMEAVCPSRDGGGPYVPIHKGQSYCMKGLSQEVTFMKQEVQSTFVFIRNQNSFASPQVYRIDDPGFMQPNTEL